MCVIVVNGKFLTQRITGVQRYARELLFELDKIVKPGEIELAVPCGVIDIPKFSNISIVCVGRLKNILWEHISFPLYVKKKKGISLNLCNVAPLIEPGIVCIHDVKIKVRPHDFSKKFLLWYNLLFFNECKRAKKIITVSEFSKKEICKYYSVEEDRVFVVPNAWQHYERIAYDANTLNKYNLKKDQFFFSMSSMEPNKNFRWIAETAKCNSNELFVVAGAINKKVFADGLGFDCPKNMKLLGYVSDEEAKTLMRDCKAFIFPTFYEGFGIPPLEAISAGCKCVFVSDTEVMHEIFKGSVNYVNPNAPLENIIGEYELRSASAEVVSKYSWQMSAKILLKEILKVE